VTDRGARILRLTRGEGEIRDNGLADLLVVADSGQTPAQALQEFSPDLVILGGRIQLVAARLASKIDPKLTQHLHKIEVEGRGLWLANVNVSRLVAATEPVLGPDFRLAGRRVRA